MSGPGRCRSIFYNPEYTRIETEKAEHRQEAKVLSRRKLGRSNAVSHAREAEPREQSLTRSVYHEV